MSTEDMLTLSHDELLEVRKVGVTTDSKWSLEQHKLTIAKAHPVFLRTISILGNVASLFFMASSAINGEIRYFNIFLLTAFMCLYVDLLSGALHLVLDNPLFLNTPGIGKMCLGFQQHHQNTSLIFNMDLSDHIVPILTPLAVVYAMGALIHGYNNIGFCVFYVACSFSIIWMQLCHRWAHMPGTKRGPIINKLQAAGIALSPASHLQHHQAPYMHTFCIMNGLCNPLMNRFVKIPGFSPHSRVWGPIFIGMAVFAATCVPSIYFL